VLVVDGSQAAGAIPVSVDDLGADIYIVPASTWLLGPEGIGGMAVRKEILPRVPGGAPRAGEFHVPSVVGLARSCGWLSMYVGLDWIFARSAALAAVARSRLAAIPGVQLLTPDPGASPTTAFRIGGWDALSALEELGARVFALASVLGDANALRIGTGFFNTEDELDRFATAVELLATHTPDSLPPRRQLTIIGGDR
jgi:selenocysteine lyase/cysteine desulfurase